MAFTDDAKACGECSPVKVGLSDGAKVPANVAAIPFIADSNGSAGSIRLFDSTNTEIPTSIQDDTAGFPTEDMGTRKLLVPSSPLTEGASVRVKLVDSCYEQGPETEQSLDVGPAQSLTEVGVLSGKSPVRVKLIDPTTAHYDACGVSVPKVIEVDAANPAGTVEAVAIDVVLKPTSELRAFAPVTGFVLSVDGEEQQRTAYGEAQASGDDRIVGRVRAACDPSASTRGEASVGTHTIGIRAHVAGATSDLPEITTTLTFSCAAGDTGSPDGGAASSPDASTPDASTQGTNGAADGASSEDSGCAVGRESSNAWGQIGAFFAGLALVVSSRSMLRRRSRSRSR